MINLSKYIYVGLTCTLIFCSGGNAHSQTEDPIIKARMMAMKEIALSLKTLSKINRGMKSFNLTEIEDLLLIIENRSSEVPDLFKIYATDPFTEAATEIWSNFDDFKNLAKDMETIASQSRSNIKTKEQIGDAIKDLGKTCKSCHSKYRN